MYYLTNKDYIVSQESFERSSEQLFKTIDGALAFNETYNVGDIVGVYIPHEYSGKYIDPLNSRKTDPRVQTINTIRGVTIAEDTIVLKRIGTITLKNYEIFRVTTPFGSNPEGNIFDFKKWNYEYNIENPKYLIESASNEVETLLMLHEYEKNIMIEESAAGAMLVLIPKLIKFILLIINKIMYLLAIPLVQALIHNTKNIRKTGTAVVSGETSIKEVVSSANLDNVRAAVVSAAKGDVAKFVEELDKSLEDVQTTHVNKVAEENKQEKNVYTNLGSRNLEIIEDINATVRSSFKIIDFIDPKKIKIMTDSLEMLKDENLVHLTFDYITGFDYEVLTKFENVNNRYDLKYLEKYLAFVEELVESLEAGNDLVIVDVVRQDTSDNRKIFSSYFLECVARMKPIEEWLPKDLFRDHFRINDGKVLNNLQVHTDYGDFKHLKDTGRLKHGPIIDMLREAKDDLDSVNAMSTRSYAFYSGHVKNVNNSDEIESRRKYIDSKLKTMQDRVEKLSPENVGYGLEYSYVVALLEFLRNDLSNILFTIKYAKTAYLDNYENMIEVIGTMAEEIAGSYMYLIVDDIIKNPNIYKVTEEGLRIIIQKFKDLGGVV